MKGDNRPDGERLWGAMQASNYISYGRSTPISFVHQVLGIEIPEVGTKEDFQRLQFREMNAVNFVRGKLLNIGMHLVGGNGVYRIPLPSENSHYAANMFRSARKDIKRAETLLRNTPKEPGGNHDNGSALAMMIQDGIKEREHHMRAMK